MAGGRGGSAGDRPSGDEESYDWLYDVRGKGVGSTPDPGPEPTRVLPPLPPTGTPAGGASGRAGAAGRSAGSPPPPGGPPGGPPGRGPARRGGSPTPPGPPPAAKRRRVPRLRWLLLLVLAWLLFLVGTPLYAWSSVSRVPFEPKGDRPTEQPGTTYLVVGSDARKGLGGRRTDTIMLLHTGDGPPVLMSLPRDSLVEVPGYGVTKINAAFAYGGPRLLVRTIEGSTGIRVDDYVEIGFRGFQQLVDAVGGITICPTTAMKDPQAELDIPAGCQEADGATALGYARSRKTQKLGDIDRARHQREVVSAIGAEVVSWQTIVNPVRYWNVVTAGAESVKVGEDTGPLSAARFARAMTQVDGDGGLTCGVPIADLAVNWDLERANRLFRLIREDRTDEIGKRICTPSGLAR